MYDDTNCKSKHSNISIHRIRLAVAPFSACVTVKLTQDWMGKMHKNTKNKYEIVIHGTVLFSSSFSSRNIPLKWNGKRKRKSMSLSTHNEFVPLWWCSRIFTLRLAWLRKREQTNMKWKKKKSEQANTGKLTHYEVLKYTNGGNNFMRMNSSYAIWFVLSIEYVHVLAFRQRIAFFTHRQYQTYICARTTYFSRSLSLPVWSYRCACQTLTVSK